MRPVAFFVTAAWLQGCQPEPVWTADSLPPDQRSTAPCAPAPGASGMCAMRCGAYVTAFEQVTGDCGGRSEQVAQLSGDPTRAPAPCRGTFSATEDACGTQFDIRCPTKDDSGTTLASIERGSLRWSADASRADGSSELWVVDAAGKARCHSEYVVTVQRQ